MAAAADADDVRSLRDKSRETDTDRQTHKETEVQTERQTHRQKDRQRGRQRSMGCRLRDLDTARWGESEIRRQTRMRGCVSVGLCVSVCIYLSLCLCLSLCVSVCLCLSPYLCDCVALCIFVCVCGSAMYPERRRRRAFGSDDSVSDFCGFGFGFKDVRVAVDDTLHQRLEDLQHRQMRTARDRDTR